MIERAQWRNTSRMAVAVMVAAAALAAGGARMANAVELRTGFSASPGQFVFGLGEQLTTSNAAIGIIPSVEAGVGSSAFSLTGQGDVVYRFPHTTGPRPYAGLGAAVYYFKPDGGGSGTNGGINLVGGIVLDPQSRARVLVDARIRLTNRLPKARVVVGFEF